MNLVKWLYPGMHVKRWMLLIGFGIVILSLGIAYVLREVYESWTFPEFAYYLTLQFIDRVWRGLLFVLLGVAALIVGLWQVNRSLLSALLPETRDVSIADAVYRRRILPNGPRVVAIGGGTGLSSLLRGLKDYTTNLTAIVTVADDGGSSGRLREELGVLPPGDFRNCIAAMADAEPLMRQLFQYRFNGGGGLEGHSFGNLFIVAMMGVTGNFEQALAESSRVLAVQGEILPSTLENVTLCAELEDGTQIRGESTIGHSTSPIRRLYLDPDATAYPDAIRAILQADLIILGPGSLYTSVLPNLLVTGIRKAVESSGAIRAYICNVATQEGETESYTTAEAHVQALQRHAGRRLFDFAVANSNIAASPAGHLVTEPVRVEGTPIEDVSIVLADVVDERKRHHHDPTKLAEAIMRLYYDRADEWSAAREAEVRDRATGLARA